MIERKFYGGPIDVHCDACPNGIETGSRDFAMARLIIKDDGWKIRKFGDDWLHLCPDHDEPLDGRELVRAGKRRVE
tara:strand:+ start:82364 stop:82591 length:228 start_codon:yes stop_codon:yes gene_type:complete